MLKALYSFFWLYDNTIGFKKDKTVNIDEKYWLNLQMKAHIKQMAEAWKKEFMGIK